MSLRLSIPTHMTLEIGHSDPRKEESLAPACTRKYSKWKATSLTLKFYCQVCIPKAFHAWSTKLDWGDYNITPGELCQITPAYFRSSLDHQWINPGKPCQKHILCSPTCKDCGWPEGGSNALWLSISRCLAQVECTVERLMKPFSFLCIYIYMLNYRFKTTPHVNSFSLSVQP